VVSGFHSKIEKDVFHYLLKGTQPIILVLARGLYKRIPVEFQKPLNESRLLIISPFDKTITRASSHTAYIRNKFILEISDDVTIPYISKDGLLSKVIIGSTFQRLDC